MCQLFAVAAVEGVSTAGIAAIRQGGFPVRTGFQAQVVRRIRSVIRFPAGNDDPAGLLHFDLVAVGKDDELILFIVNGIKHRFLAL